MRVITLTARAGADGRLRIDVLDADAGTEYEVVLTAKPPTPEERGWPKGYFEAIGNLDDTFERPPQPPLRPVDAFDVS